ncbi:hypothetical protein C8R42DRAFT_667112 [Lentinula raphanica]|nr:hypothetical protein C8R42DRAFT_667112 [Lentinula raphanica]
MYIPRWMIISVFLTILAKSARGLPTPADRANPESQTAPSVIEEQLRRQAEQQTVALQQKLRELNKDPMSSSLAQEGRDLGERKSFETFSGRTTTATNQRQA